MPGKQLFGSGRNPMVFAVYEYLIFGQRLELYQTVTSASLSEPPDVTNPNVTRRQFTDVALQWVKSAGVSAVKVNASQLALPGGKFISCTT